MKWFYISFTEMELFARSDEMFIREFVDLLHIQNHPAKLGLYKLKFHLDEGAIFYIATPKEISQQVKSVLSHFPASEVSHPNLNVLELILGKDGILVQS